MPSYHPIALDLETTGLDPDRDQIVMLSWWDGKKETGGVIRDLVDIRRFLERVKLHPKLFWNAPFDLRFIKNANLPFPTRAIDVRVLARLVSSAEISYKLKHLGAKYLGEATTEEQQLKAWMRRNKKPMHEAPSQLLDPYALKDAQMTWELYYVFAGRIDDSVRRLLELEIRVMRAVIEMEHVGFLVDTDYAKELLEQVEEEIGVLMEELRQEVEDPAFNPASMPQLQVLFYRRLKVDVLRRTKKGQPSTSRLALLDMPDRVQGLAQGILRYRKLQKAASTYLRNLIEKSDKNRVLRVVFNQAGATTGRFSSSGPNMQNIPRPGDDYLGHVRDCIMARPGYRLVCIDYDQVELRLTAHFTQEEEMLRVIRSGGDLHALTARKIFHVGPEDDGFAKYRHLAKTLNFAIVYGAGASAFRDTLLNDAEIRISLPAAKKAVIGYRKAYPGVDRFFRKVEEHVEQHGCVRNVYGRQMRVVRNRSYAGVNYIIQGTAADLMKERLAACHEFLKGSRSRMLGTVHDELIFEIHQSERHLIGSLKGIMEEHTAFSVPLTCSVAFGKRWGQKKEIQISSTVWHYGSKDKLLVSEENPWRLPGAIFSQP